MITEQEYREQWSELIEEAEKHTDEYFEKLRVLLLEKYAHLQGGDEAFRQECFEGLKNDVRECLGLDDKPGLIDLAVSEHFNELNQETAS